MRIALVQMAASVDDLASNQEKIGGFVRQCIEEGAQLICFPEMALIGYGFDHMNERLSQQATMLKELQVMAIEYGITVMVGGIEACDEDLYIAQFVITQTIESYRKIHIGVKEGQYVCSGDEIKVFHIRELTIGLMLCYDGHFPELATIMKDQGAQIILNPSASPNLPHKRVAMWEKYLVARAYDNRIWVGAMNLRFKGKGGGTFVVNGDGDTIASTALDQDIMTIVDYKSETYSEKAMKRRDFTVDRRTELYKKYR